MGTFFKNDIFSGKFFGQNSAFELKVDGKPQIDNRLSFPKYPSKSRLSLFGNKISNIAENNQNGDRIGGQTRISINIFIMNGNV